jgi:heme-degrading monooxygenase HmoA
MFARATRIEGSPDRLDEAIRQFREETLPAAQSQAGFGGGMLLADRSTGAALAVTLWETEENMAASEQFANQQRTQVAEAAGAQSAPRIERYEVAVSL